MCILFTAAAILLNSKNPFQNLQLWKKNQQSQAWLLYRSLSRQKTRKNKGVMMYLSNKTIFAILAVTLIIAVTGTFVNLSKIYDLGFLGLTGAAVSSDQGNATITITQQTSITNNFNDIQFGSGFVNASCTACVMDSNGTRASVGCCGTFNMSNNLGFLFENTGNINLSVSGASIVYRKVNVPCIFQQETKIVAHVKSTATANRSPGAIAVHNTGGA